MRTLEKLIGENGFYWGNSLCLIAGIVIFSCPFFQILFRAFGVSLALLGFTYHEYDVSDWEWLMKIYPFLGMLTLILGILGILSIVVL
jgi:hypothetical protein